MSIQIDYGFPIIEYKQELSPLENGINHGMLFSEGIKELVQIRKALMLAKNPRLVGRLDELALIQFEESKKMNPNIALEMQGIAQGAQCSLSDIVILNNYTDFRDITLPDEGCTTIYVKTKEQSLGGQTWDMHSSAKRFLCVIKTPNEYILTLLGCVGLMGIGNNGLFIGVNNINTTDAKPGVIWPALVRHCLEVDSFDEMEDRLITANVTSGHNYLIGSKDIGKHWEITPNIKDEIYPNQSVPYTIFHTNHCLGINAAKIEDKASLSSTTHARFELAQSLTKNIQNLEGLEGFLKSHEGFPKSICSHFENGAQDPSMTCGGAVFDFNSGVLKFWRGCQTHDTNYKEYLFKVGK